MEFSFTKWEVQSWEFFSIKLLLSSTLQKYDSFGIFYVAIVMSLSFDPITLRIDISLALINIINPDDSFRTAENCSCHSHTTALMVLCALLYNDWYKCLQESWGDAKGIADYAWTRSDTLFLLEVRMLFMHHKRLVSITFWVYGTPSKLDHLLMAKYIRTFVNSLCINLERTNTHKLIPTCTISPLSSTTSVNCQNPFN